MRSIRIAVALTLAVAPAVFAQSATQAAATITEADVKKHIAFLASDELMGRDTPSPGLEMAAKYVADQFKALGLKPAGDSGTYIQRWPYNVRKLDVARLTVALHGAGTHSAPRYGSEFFIIPSAALDTLSGEIVFAGIAAPSSTADASFKGNIVAYAIPGAELNSEWQQKAQGAVMAAMVGGAKGVVLVLDPAIDAAGVGMVAAGTEASQAPMPILGIRNDVAAAWLKGSSADMSVAQTPGAPKLVAGRSIGIKTSVAAQSSNPPNAVAILEGSDPELKNTYVVYSAHMDHIGVTAPDAQGDSINNGADDDASGTSAVLELAQAFTSLNQRPKRSIIFLLVSGEEKGLFGSKYFVENPPVPAEKIVANINMDMIGRNTSDTTVAIGQDYSTLGDATQAIVKAHPELKLTVAPDLWPEEQLFFRSDHFNFAMKKIPAIFFTSGLHDEYHQPSDEPETIDSDKLVRTTRLVFWLGNAIANNATAPTWTEAGLKAVQAAGANGQ
jgi:Zn-dependent M28 family amino/carboxypeptidase